MLQLFGLALIVCGAFFVEAALGFGATVVTVALGALLFPIDQILPAFIPLNIILSSVIATRYRRHIAWRLLLGRIVPLMGLGLPFGLLLFGSQNDRLLLMGFGLFVVALSSIELVTMKSANTMPARQLPLTKQVVLLLAGGVIHGAYATGGPMAIYVAGRDLREKSEFRASLSMLWLVLNLALMVGYALTGDLNRSSFELSLILAVPLLVGMVLGEWLQGKVDQKVFRLLVFVLLFLAGWLLFWKAL